MLENPRSPRVRAVAKLAKKAARAESGLFLLEGPQAVAEALRLEKGNVSRAATRLGVHRNKVRRWLERNGLDRSVFGGNDD